MQHANIAKILLLRCWAWQKALRFPILSQIFGSFISVDLITIVTSDTSSPISSAKSKVNKG